MEKQEKLQYLLKTRLQKSTLVASFRIFFFYCDKALFQCQIGHLVNTIQ